MSFFAVSILCCFKSLNLSSIRICNFKAEDISNAEFEAIFHEPLSHDRTYMNNVEDFVKFLWPSWKTRTLIFFNSVKTRIKRPLKNVTAKNPPKQNNRYINRHLIIEKNYIPAPNKILFFDALCFFFAWYIPLCLLPSLAWSIRRTTFLKDLHW